MYLGLLFSQDPTLITYCTLFFFMDLILDLDLKREICKCCGYSEVFKVCLNKRNNCAVTELKLCS